MSDYKLSEIEAMLYELMCEAEKDGKNRNPDTGWSTESMSAHDKVVEFVEVKDERIAELEGYADKLAAGLPDGILPKDVEVLREANAGMSTDINKAVDLILEFGFIDGGHHKQWLLDQVLRVLLGEGYQDRIDEYNEPEDYFDWDTGIAP